MKWIIGIDEVGRGPVAGPVAVCACAMPLSSYRKMKWQGLNDSKKMTQKAREKWYQEAKALKREGKIVFSVIYRSNTAIDKKGIAPCIRECVANSLKRLSLPAKDTLVLLDGSLKTPPEYKNQRTIIKGDQKEKIISLASVIAKVSRDAKMDLLHKKYPLYNWKQNKGYGTAEHYRAIHKNGLSLVHRKTFLTSPPRGWGSLTKV